GCHGAVGTPHRPPADHPGRAVADTQSIGGVQRRIPAFVSAVRSRGLRAGAGADGTSRRVAPGGPGICLCAVPDGAARAPPDAFLLLGSGPAGRIASLPQDRRLAMAHAVRDRLVAAGADEWLRVVPPVRAGCVVDDLVCAPDSESVSDRRGMAVCSNPARPRVVDIPA